ncbi:MAG TPA: hypothetical protein VN944_08825, partial [Nitrospiria bacterium]|nr:hypothetical protein [Nitrospiria bacterium]
MKAPKTDMKKHWPNLVFLLVLLFLTTGIGFTQKGSDLISSKMSRAEYFMTLPKGELLKSVSL